MAINGCLTLAWLEEDDPSRGFFRVRPAAVISAEPEAYVHGGEYGEEGFLRVVPDKNEMSTFKLRMRTLGRLCLIDLRAHPRENDKIRQNKNYALGTDHNPFMIYSDVIRRLPDDLVCQLADSRGETVTRRAFLREGEELCGPYCVAEDGWRECEEYARVPQEQCPGRILELSDGRSGCATLIIKRVENVNALSLSPISDFVPEREPRTRPQPAPEPSHAAPEPQPAPESAEPKQDDGADYALRRLKEQMGLNPRKGRSLSEVVDEQWRMRRQDELGQTVPPLAASEPVSSPAERALEAISAAWQFSGARAPLIQGIIARDELIRRLFEVYEPGGQRAPTDARLVELEAERLRLITELDGLRRRTREMKAEVLRELRQTGEADAEALRNSIVLLDEQVELRKRRLDELEASARSLEEEITKALDRPLTERLAGMLADSRLRELLPTAESHAPERAPEQPQEQPVARALLTPEELTDRVSLCLCAHGWQFSRDDISHMLTVMALGRPLILSGFSGCDDMRLGEALCEALGDAGPGPCVRLNGGGSAPESGGRCLRAVLDYPDGSPVKAAQLDAGFLMRDTSALCLPGDMPELPELDEASFGRLLGGRLSEAVRDRLMALTARLGEFGARVSHGALYDCARYVASAAARMSGGEAGALDYALASRVLPAVMLTASDALIRALPGIFEGMERCMRIMRAPLPVDR